MPASASLTSVPTIPKRGGSALCGGQPPIRISASGTFLSDGWRGRGVRRGMSLIVRAARTTAPDIARSPAGTRASASTGIGALSSGLKPRSEAPHPA